MSSSTNSKPITFVRDSLEEVLPRILPGPVTPQKLVQLDEQEYDEAETTRTLFPMLFQAMLTCMPRDELTRGCVESGRGEDVLHILVDVLQSMQPSRQRDDIVDLILLFIHSDAFLFSSLRPCFNMVDRWQWEAEWLKPVSSLVDVLGNILQRYLPFQLSSQRYCRFMAIHLATCLFVLSEGLKYGVSVNVEPLALILNQVCNKYTPSFLLEPLFELVACLTRDNFIARRIWAKVICFLDDRCLDKLISYSAIWSKHVEVFKRLVGPPQFPLDVRWNNILCNRMLFLRCYASDDVARNVLTYLKDDQKLLLKVTLDLLNIWSDRNVLLLTSTEQHEFISKCIIVSMGLLESDLLVKNRVEIHGLLRAGINHHLESTHEKVRILGMSIAELCTRRIHPDGPQLTFQYDKTDPYVKELETLMQPQPPYIESFLEDFEVSLNKLKENQDTDRSSKSSLSSSSKFKTQELIIPSLKTNESEEKMLPAGATEDLDSDDDLEPYDMSEDKTENKVEAPYYIRDLMEMLGNAQDEREEYEKMRVALENSERLIREQLPYDHPSLTPQLLSILIRLENKYSIPDFVSMRMKAMIAAGVAFPTEAAQYLTHEFFQSNYSVAQRIDLLHIIKAIARELSSQSSQCQSAQGISGLCDLPQWRKVVQERIEAKTRRFFPSSSDRRDHEKAFENQFTPSAGLFFFPLARKLDQSTGYLNLIEDDFMLLTELLHTMTLILSCTGPVPIVSRMVRSLIDIVWVLRLHREASVRQAVMVAFSQALISTDNGNLISDYGLELVEWKDWLLQAMEKDVSTDVRLLAQNAILLLNHMLREANFL